MNGSEIIDILNFNLTLTSQSLFDAINMNISSDSNTVVTSLIFMSGKFNNNNKKFNWLNIIFKLIISLVYFIYILNLYKVNIIHFIIFIINNSQYLKYIWLTGIFLGILYYILCIILMGFFSKNKKIKIPETYPKYINMWLNALHLIGINNVMKNEYQKIYKIYILIYSIVLIAGICVL